MRHRFAVIASVGSRTRLFVAGSRPELGDWNPERAVPLWEPHPAGPSTLEPRFYAGDVEIEGTGRHAFYFKFLKVEEGGDVIWEGCGPGHNRSSPTEGHEVAEAVVGAVLCHPVAHWLEPGGHTNEWSHTTAFYLNIAGRQDMHYSRVLPRLWLGSCPRLPAHVSLTLRGQLGVTAVLNLQTADDLESNSGACALPGAAGSAAERVRALCHHHGVAYVWMPTADMSSDGRRDVLPQAVWLLHGLLSSGHTAYVHCNAGVGRAPAVVAGYLCYVLGWAPRRAQHHLAARRPATFLDGDALRRARGDFRRKFGAALRRGDATPAGEGEGAEGAGDGGGDGADVGGGGD